MGFKPVIFISAVSRELHSARDLVAKTLLALGYEPKWQDITPTETGVLRGVLRKWVDESEGVIQLVGDCYGCGPKEADADFGRCSYTQYEALYARKVEKKVWYLVLDDGFDADPHEPEADELRALQQSYREQVRGCQQLYHPLHNSDALEARVLKLRNELAHLRRRGRQWAALVIVLLAVTASGILWLTTMQRRQSQTITVLQDQNDKMLQAIHELPRTIAQIIQNKDSDDETVRVRSAYAILEARFELEPGTMEKLLPAFVARVLADPDPSNSDLRQKTTELLETTTSLTDAQKRLLMLANSIDV